MFQRRTIVLLYHRVAEVFSDPLLLCVTPKHFEEHLQHLRLHYQLIGLRNIKQALDNGRVPNNAVVITFDDGYADNLWNAKPLLERYEVPATVFTTAGYVGQNENFWWHDLEHMLLQPKVLPSVLNLSVKGKIHTWELNEAVCYSQADFNRHRRWHVLTEDCPTQRHQVYRTLCELLRPLSHGERHGVLTELAAWAGADLVERSDHRALTSKELAELTRGGLVEVGAHTMTHPVLSALTVEAQRVEISGSKHRLEEVLRQPVTSFAYPYGRPSDYNADTVRLVRDAGFDCACSNVPGLVTRKNDPYQLPRFVVRDWDGEEFARRLSVLFNG